MTYLETNFAEMQLRDNILFFRYKQIPQFDLSVAKQLVADRLRLQREQAYPVLCDMRQYNQPDLEARRYLAVQGSVLIRAVAYLIPPDTRNHVIYFFISVDQPVGNANIFTHEQEALRYLKKYV